MSDEEGQHEIPKDREPDLLSEILDVNDMPLAAFRDFQSPALKASMSEATVRTERLIVTASGSAGAKRVE